MIRFLALVILAMSLSAAVLSPPELPQATSASIVGPSEILVSLDREIAPQDREAILAEVNTRSIPYYDFAFAGDEARPKGEPLGHLRIADSRFDDAQTLRLATDPHPRRAVYVVDWGKGRQDAPARYLFSGVEAKAFATAEATDPTITTVVPRFAFGPDAFHDKLPAKFSPQRIELLARLSVPGDAKALVMVGTTPFEGAVDNLLSEPEQADGMYRLEIPLEETGTTIEVFAGLRTMPTEAKTSFSAAWKTGEGETPVAMSEIALPWLPTERAQAEVPDPPYNLAGGDPAKGETIFRSESAKCAACHVKDGKGGAVGPSLDMLKGRDAREIYQSIAEPSARIAPEYRTFTIARKDGQVAVGVMRTESFSSIRVMDINGQATIIPHKEIDEMQPSETSTMPVGLAGAIGEAGMRDLIAYLLN